MQHSFRNTVFLDLGCGYGWHCIYAAEHGAESVVGIDISEKMLGMAEEKNAHESIQYRRLAMEDLEFPKGAFDAVVSSLASHYVKDFESLVEKIRQWMTPGGKFVFSVL